MMMPDSAPTVSSPPQQITWLAAQKRPFAAANVGALAFFAVAAVAGVPHPVAPESRSWLLWPGPLFYLAVLLSFLLPLWLVQATVYAQMWQRGQPYFVRVTAAPYLEPHRRCRFLLSLRSVIIVLAVLYLDSPEQKRAWTRPSWLFLGLFAMALLAFCLWTIFIPLLPPVLLLSAITFWSASLMFGLSHLLRGD